MTVSRRQLDWRIAVCESDLDVTAKYVALVLDTFMDKRGFAYPSRETLAERSRLVVRAVQEATNRLEQAGFLIVLRSRGRHSNRYQATHPNPAPLYGVGGGPTVHTGASQPRTRTYPTPHGGAPEAVRKPSEKPERRTRADARAPAEPGREIHLAQPKANPQALVARYVDLARELDIRVPRRVVGQVAQQVGQLAGEGYPAATIERALVLMLERRLHPSTLQSLMVEAQAGPARPRRPEHVVDRLARHVVENRERLQ